MGITTFAKLITASASRKVFLVEVDPSELLESWTLYSGSVYYQDIGRYHVLSVYEDGVALTETTSIAGVTAGKWYHDVAAGRLYVRATSGTPFSKTMVANYRLYFSSATETGGAGIVFNDRFYEPFVLSTPSLRQKKTDLFWGVSIISDGGVSLANHDRYFDSIYNRFAWNNKDIRVLLGGEDLPYSEYEEMFSGRVFNKVFGFALFDLSFVDRKYDLSDSPPLNEFTVAAYPNIEGEFVGRPIPQPHGTVYRMPATCVTGALGSATTSHSFKFADTSLGSVFALSTVYVNGNTIAHLSASLSAGTFKLSSTVFSVGDLVSVDCQGYTSGGALVENPIEILKTILGLKGITYDADNFDTTLMAAAVLDAEVFPVGYAIVAYTPTLAMVQALMRSCMGTLYVTNAGVFAVTVWNTDIPSSPTELTELDIVTRSFRANAKVDDVRKVVRVGWQKRWDDETYRYSQDTSETTEQVYGITKSRTIETLLSTQAGVTVYLGRMLLMHENETTEIKFDSKLLLAAHNIGDRFAMSFKRRADDSNLEWLDYRILDIQQIDKDFDRNVIRIIADDMKGIGGGVGHWTSDAPTFPDTLGGGSLTPWDADWSPAQKAYAKTVAGYWTDADGFADTADPDSRRLSRWW